MEKLNIILSVFIVELLVDVLVLRIFKIRHAVYYILFLQIPKICATVICLFYSEIIWMCILLKILSKLLCIIFLTDSFKMRRMLMMFLLQLFILFSVGGFFLFVVLWINGFANDVFLQKIPKNYTYLVIISIILYIFAFFVVVRYMDKNRILKKLKTKVSLKFNQKHIYLYGLIDSGNSLFDPITKRPVVIVSACSLKRNLAGFELNDLFLSRCRRIKYDTISGSGFEIPIFKPENFLISVNGESRKISCMIGIVDHKFERGKIDCLLHRDFL